MTATAILGNGTLLTGGIHSRVVDRGAVAWRDGRIVATGSEVDVVREHPDAHFMDACGGLILPGFINLHHHFYSALARGLDPGVELKGFDRVLEGLWWRLDRALTSEAVHVSALLTAADCIRSGCT
jgi:cytosine/adenosine deaminase-related metal-dependent hydrolase